MNIKAAVLEILFESNSAKVRADINGVNKEVEKTGKDGSKNVDSFKQAFTDLAVVTGSVTAGIVAMKKVIEFGREGAQLQRLEDAGYSLAASMDSNMRDIISAVQAASLGTVSEMDIIQSTNRAMMLGLGADAEQLANLMEIAAFRARAMGISTTQAFNDIVTGIGRQSPLILDNLGIVIDSNRIYEEYALKIGTSKDKLEEHQKTQALFNDVLETGNAMMATQNGLVLDNAGQWEKLDASLKDYMDSLKKSSSGPLAEIALMLNVHVSEWNIDKEFKELKAQLKEAGIEVKEFDAQWKDNQNFMGWVEDTNKANKILKEMQDLLDDPVPGAFVDSFVGAYQGVGLAVDDTNEAMAVLNGLMAENESALVTQQRETELYILKLEEQRETQDALQGTYSELRAAQDKLVDAQKGFRSSIATDVKGALDSAGLSAQDYALALGKVDETFGTTFGRQNEMKLTIQGAVDEFKRTGDVEAFGETIGTLEGDFGDLATKIIEAQDEIDILQNKIDTLRGKEIDIFINYVIDMGIGGSGLEGGFQMPDYTVPVPDGFGVNVGAPGSTSHQIKRFGQPIQPGREAFGTSFTVPAGYPNDSFEWRSLLTSGERVTVSPSGGGGSGETSVSGRQVVHNYEIHTHPPQESGLSITEWIKMQEMLMS